MKILHMSFSDIKGGAARAAYRTHSGMRKIGIYSNMLVQFKSNDEQSINGPSSKIEKALALARNTFEPLITNLRRGHSNPEFSAEWLPFSGIQSRINRYSPDIVNLHWVCGGMLRIENIKRLDKPLVWTLHDMWPFTGGCHYSDTCDRYHESCGACPQLKGNSENDLSRSVFKRKEVAWKDANMTVVAPSHWMAECTKKSRLFQTYRIEVIPNGIDLDLYKPANKATARDIWGLPQDKKLILFGAMNATTDKRKGFDLFHESINHLKDYWQEKVELIAFGASNTENTMDFGLPIRYIGNLHDDVSLALLYSAADVMVVPSRQDNLPNTVIESMACGTPVAAFDVGGMKDMIEHLNNGYLAKPFDSVDLAKGIHEILLDENINKDLSINARKKAESDFDIINTAEKYKALYESIL